MTKVTLQISALQVRVPGRCLLEKLDFSLAAGEVLGLLGPNGSGKSTLIRAVVGILPIHQGQIQIAGHCITHSTPAAQQQIGFAPPVEMLPAALSMRQCLQLVARARHGDRHASLSQSTTHLLDSLGMTRYLDSLIETLSLGTRQKIAVVIALMHDAPLLVLDEVFNGLDFKSAHVLKTVLRARADAGAAILLATHGLELATDLLSQILLLDAGRACRHFLGAEFRGLQQGGPQALERGIVAALDRASAN